MDAAFFFVNMTGGIMADSCYPYEAVMNYCKFNPLVVAAKVTADIYGVDNEADLLAAVATYGPVSVAIWASCPSFQQYSGGVYYDQTCTPATYDVDHGGVFLAIVT
jgi:cathepsin L